LGADFQALRWDGDKPVTGLAAAARTARHRMLADAARRAGARAILMGHTGSDVLEAEAMRAAGSTTPDPKEWAPSPAWPEGRGAGGRGRRGRFAAPEILGGPGRGLPGHRRGLRRRGRFPAERGEAGAAGGPAARP